MRITALIAWLPIVAVALIVATGCDTKVSRRLEAEARQKEAYENREVRRPREAVRPQPDEVQAGLDVIEEAYQRTRRNVAGIGQPAELAVGKIGRAIEASLELGPTVVVWLVDRTPSGEGHVGPAIAAAKALYDSPALHERLTDDAGGLLTAIVAFDEQAEFLVDPPTNDVQAAKAAFDAIRPATTGREMTFAALQQALDKYLTLRTEQRREVLFVVLTDEAGEDPELVEELIPVVRRQAIPVYVVGVPTPWGQTSPFAEHPQAPDAAKDDDSFPRVGPESLYSERVDIEAPRPPSAPNLDLVDSGFGPFALEWLCRESRGKFFALRPEVNEYGYVAGGLRFRTWPPGGELRFDDEVVAKYAPDYVSRAEYQALLAENKARQALHQAAQLPTLEIEGAPETRFPKAAEAQMARVLSRAQQYSAMHAPLIDRLYEVLAAGEGDRQRLTGARWQAQYDLALGRVLAMKARLDGYNSMIAALKRGRTFEKESSIVWILEPADAYETESTIKRLAERAKTYLQRVVEEHPGTPWARIAEEELKTPMGWTWGEE